MNQQARRILEAFDARDSAELPLEALGEAGPTRADAEDLVARGFLRASGHPGCYARTEDGRLAIAGPREVTLYTRSGCHLCEEAKHAIAPLLAEFGAPLREIDVDADPILHERYTNDVPVIFLGSHKVAKHRVDPKQFRRQLEDASRG